MQYLLNDHIYINLALPIIISFILAVVILGASYGIARHNPDLEKVSSYECGFEPFQDARNRFDVRFYVVAILFLIFDLEVVYLFP
jgi:NADH-quinone oxidoreductase subunit A